MNYNEPPDPPVPGQKWDKLPWQDILTLWARGKMDPFKAISQLLLWGEDTHQLARDCDETQAVVIEEQRALAQDHQILLQKYESLLEEHVALCERVRVLERR